jgi:hypothetical protein
MRFRATAKSSERSNAAGSVELWCAPEGLHLVYQGVFALSEGYVPGAVASGTTLLVPWPGVVEASLEGDELLLLLDPRITPLNKLCLTGFTAGEARLPPEEARRRRLVVRVASGGLAISAGLAAFAGARRVGAQPSLSLAISAAVLTSLALVALGLWADRLVTSPAPPLRGEVARELFVSELSPYRPDFSRAPAAEAPARPPWLFYFERILPRTTAAIVITLSAALLGVLLTTRVIVLDESTTRRPAPSAPAFEADPQSSPEPRAPSRPAAPAPVKAAAAPPLAPSGDVVTLTESCHCPRADSPLWQAPIPRLSVLLLSQRVRRGRGPDESRRRRYLELELAVVNNGRSDIPELSLLVEFFGRDPAPSNKRYSASTRPLFYEGPLRPAQALKWSVEAEGVEFEVHNPIPGNVGQFGDDAAPADLLAELLHANHRPVRLHGVMMLTFLGDPRAREALLELREALREDEAPYLTRLLQAQAPLKVCKLQIRPGRAASSACIFNGGSEQRKDLGLRVRALSGEVSHAEPLAQPPEVKVERSYRVPGELGPSEGKTASFAFDLREERSEDFEAFADRYDLLPR